MKQYTMYIGHNVHGKPCHTKAHIIDELEAQIECVISEHPELELALSSHTVYDAKGYWHGESENTTVVVFITYQSYDWIIDKIRAGLEYILKQERILLTKQTVECL